MQAVGMVNDHLTSYFPWYFPWKGCKGLGEEGH